MTKEEREEAQKARELQRNARLSDARTRQARSDVKVYGEGSMLLSAQKSSAGGDSRGGIWDVSTDNYKQEDRNESGQNSNINDDGIDAIGRVAADGGGDSGGGLPSFPTDNGNVPDFKGILAWSVTEGEALWLQGDPDAEDSEGDPLPQVMIYDPTEGFQDFSLLGMQLLDVVICENGSPVNGKIFFKEDDV